MFFITIKNKIHPLQPDIAFAANAGQANVMCTLHGVILEKNMKQFFLTLLVSILIITSVFADKNNFYENGKMIDTMYVNSKEGLKVRGYPRL